MGYFAGKLGDLGHEMDKNGRGVHEGGDDRNAGE